MQCGGFYEIYGLKDAQGNILHEYSDVQEFSNITDYIIANKKSKLGQYNVVMAGFKTFMLDKFINKLQEFGYTIVVYTQKEQKEKSERYCSGIYSPGTMFDSISSNNENDDFIMKQNISNNICCVWMEETKKKKTIHCVYMYD